MWRLAMLAAVALASTPAHAQSISGSVQVVDGDTLRLGVMRVRLHGIDAPEAGQTCSKAGQVWECGQDATSHLARLVNGQRVTCDRRGIDDYGRMVATCRAGGIDLAESMVTVGLAVSLPDFSQAYVEAEARARAQGLGIWGSDFLSPAEFRAKNLPPPPRMAVTTEPRSTRPQIKQAGVYYRNCNEAWAAGAAPLYRGQPGYRPEMDGDRDGVACEPIRRRR